MIDDLSVGLLLEEEECRQQMEALFVGGVPSAAGKLSAVMDLGARSIGEVSQEIAGMAGRMVEATEGPFRALVRTAVGRGLESMREELKQCERTLGPKFAGLADDACDRVDDAEEQLMVLSMVQYRANAGTVLGWFGEQLTVELRVAMAREETAAELVARLVSPVSVKTEQHSGRGLWWKVLEHCNRITREVEFATVNAARTEAMLQFNRLGAERG